MPILSVFFGIVVRMWHDDHPPPHIHVEYQGFEGLVEIKTGEVKEGRLPRKVANIVKEWCLEHQQELMANWCKAQNLQTLERIRGADYD
ncbi:DUF4160 domain-containing protein [Thiomicrospira microaerophila]|uniref:DUF4160 domain-containing protein n=1 Tax=Thiomicrospira microaerophila TaxID=406020 RepID=UPI0005C9A696|nr:DUF4160 domain-containing protein [Thiomicrospira microaerophila]